MPSTLLVAFELVREARHRRWLLAIVLALSLLGVVLAFAVRVDVVNGMLTGTSFFGNYVPQKVRAAGDALQPLFVSLCWLVYTLGVPFGALACSDFAPELLMPGRVEHLLSLPVRRAELLAGTYLGVLFIGLFGASYAALILTLLLGIKAGVWSWCIVAGALSAVLAWVAVYGAMLASAVFVRSGAVSAGVGVLLFLGGVLLTHQEVAAYFDVGASRTLFIAAIAPLPRFWVLARVGPALAGLDAFDGELVRTIAGTLIFGVACVMLAIWEFERRDY